MKIEIYKDNRGQWRWRLVSGGGDVYLRSHKGFDRILGAQADIGYVYGAMKIAVRKPREKV